MSNIIQHIYLDGTTIVSTIQEGNFQDEKKLHIRGTTEGFDLCFIAPIARLEALHAHIGAALEDYGREAQEGS